MKLLLKDSQTCCVGKYKGWQATHLYGRGTLCLPFFFFFFLMISLFCKVMIGGSYKIYWSYSWFCIRLHFSIQASFIVDTEGWYCVTNGNISFSSLLFCFRFLDSLLWILFLIIGFLSKMVGSLRPSSVFFFFLIWTTFLKGCFWGVFSCVQEGFRLYKMCLCIKDRFSLNLVPLYTRSLGVKCFGREFYSCVM